MSMQDDRDEKDISPIDLSRDENDSDPDGKSRTKYLRIHEKLSSPSRIRPLSETLREAAERQGNYNYFVVSNNIFENEFSTSINPSSNSSR